MNVTPKNTFRSAETVDFYNLMLIGSVVAGE